LANGPVIIDRPLNSLHPYFAEIIYPLDYGYLEGNKAVDGSGVDVCVGTSGIHEITGIILTVDLRKPDAEIKIALGCIDEEIKTKYEERIPYIPTLTAFHPLF
jgi:inorganic pyrophosphatase